MKTNVGSTKTSEEGNVPDYIAVFYDKEAITNFYSANTMVVKGNHVFLNTRIKNSFIATDRKGRETKFPCNERGLYAKEKFTPID